MSAPAPVPSYPVDPRVQLGGRIRQLRAHHGDDDPRTLTARQDLAAAQIEIAIAKAVASAPPLRPEQVDRIASILHTPAGAR